MKKIEWIAAVSVMVLMMVTGCSNYANVPPNDIAMVLTPTGYEEKIYTPGQVDIKDTSASNMGNSIVLLQRSGISIYEQFMGPEGTEDKQDHRCLTADKAPATLDVRLLLAIPDYSNPDGLKDLKRIFMLGNPEIVNNATPQGRVLRISGDAIYTEQAQQQVRGRIRQVIASYKNFDAVFAAYTDESENGLSKKIENAVAKVLKENGVPLKLVSAFPSNLKPDISVTEAIAAKQAADKRVEAIRTLTDFMNEDRSGARWKVYNMQSVQEIVKTANANGHNTLMMFDVGGGGGDQRSRIIPIPK